MGAVSAVIDRIPVGARVEIFNREGKPVAAGALLEEWTVSTSSSYKQLISDQVPGATLLNAIGSITGQLTNGSLGFSAEMKQFGAALWESSSVATFDFSLEFYMTYSGLEEVTKPIARLQKLVAPAEGKTGNLKAPGPTILDIWGVVNYTSPVGHAPNIDEINVGDDRNSEASNYNAQESLLSVRVGNMVFDKLIMLSADSTLSKYIDTDGYPIYGKVAVKMQTMYIPTKQQVANWFGF